MKRPGWVTRPGTEVAGLEQLRTARCQPPAELDSRGHLVAAVIVLRLFLQDSGFRSFFLEEGWLTCVTWVTHQMCIARADTPETCHTIHTGHKSQGYTHAYTQPNTHYHHLPFHEQYRSHFVLLASHTSHNLLKWSSVYELVRYSYLSHIIV